VLILTIPKQLRFIPALILLAFVTLWQRRCFGVKDTTEPVSSSTTTDFIAALIFVILFLGFYATY
jgi:nitrate reductase gamma subunit